jgi:hypothetical protein
VQCQGKGVLISGMKITENKSTSVNIIVKTGTVLLEQIVMLSSSKCERGGQLGKSWSDC